MCKLIKLMSNSFLKQSPLQLVWTALTEPPTPPTINPLHSHPVPAPFRPFPTGATMWIIKNSGPFRVGGRLWVSVSRLRLYWNPTQLQWTVALLRRDAAAAHRHFCLPGSRRSLLHHGWDSYILFIGLAETIHGIVWSWGHVGWNPHPMKYDVHAQSGRSTSYWPQGDDLRRRIIGVIELWTCYSQADTLHPSISGPSSVRCDCVHVSRTHGQEKKIRTKQEKKLRHAAVYLQKHLERTHIWQHKTRNWFVEFVCRNCFKKSHWKQ